MDDLNNNGAASAIADSLADEQPEVSEHTVQAEQHKDSLKKAAWAEYADTAGNPFDAEMHVTNSEGEPVLTKNGKLRRRPGRKSSGSTASGGSSQIGGASQSAQIPGQDQVKIESRATGRHAARLLTSMAVAFGGDEWRPMYDEKLGVDEGGQLEGAFADYFESKEMNDIPPGIALCVVVGAYALPRFTMPKTQSRIGRFKDKLAGMYFNMKNRKAKKAKGFQNESQHNSGDDGKRKNESGETTGGTLQA